MNAVLKRLPDVTPIADPQIVMRNVTKRFRRGGQETLALSDVNLEIGLGEPGLATKAPGDGLEARGERFEHG